MSAVVEEIIEKLKTLTLIEASELVKGIEETFGVSAAATAAPVMMTGGGGGGGATTAVEPEAEQTEFSVILDEVPADKKIAVLKEVRAVTGLGLKEAKELVDTAPKPLKEGIPKEEAEKIKKQIEASGAKVSVK